jgi:hypothetical protein
VRRRPPRVPVATLGMKNIFAAVGLAFGFAEAPRAARNSQSIVPRLARIQPMESHFDCVVILLKRLFMAVWFN